MNKIYWFFEELKLVNISEQFQENDSSETLIQNVIDSENLMILDFLNERKFNFTCEDLEYSVISGKLNTFKYFLSLEEGKYNLNSSWAFSYAAENEKYNIVDFLITRPYNYDLFAYKAGIGLSEVQEASYHIGENFNYDMIFYLHWRKHFDPIACIIGILTVSSDTKNIETIKKLCSLSNNEIVEKMELHPMKEISPMNSVDKFKTLYPL
jgi:hypothetical protein